MFRVFPNSCCTFLAFVLSVQPYMTVLLLYLLSALRWRGRRMSLWFYGRGASCQCWAFVWNANLLYIAFTQQLFLILQSELDLKWISHKLEDLMENKRPLCCFKTHDPLPSPALLLPYVLLYLALVWIWGKCFLYNSCMYGQIHNSCK